MEKFRVSFKQSAIKQLRSFPTDTQQRILTSINSRLAGTPHIADGKHIKKLLEGYRLRVGNYRIFYYIQFKEVILTSIVRRTSTTY